MGLRVRTRTHSSTRTHAQTHTEHTHTHTQRHTHTHTQAPSLSPFCPLKSKQAGWDATKVAFHCLMTLLFPL